MNEKLKIQYIDYERPFIHKDITSVSVNEIINFDNFDYNIIDLQDELIFREFRNNYNIYESKIRELRKSLESTHSNVIILLPTYKISDFNIKIRGVIQNLLKIDMCSVECERNYTTINNNKFENFYYFKLDNITSKLWEDKFYDDTNKNKITVLKRGNLLITSMNFNIEESSTILPKLFEDNLGKIKVPEWAKNFNAFDDLELKENNEKLNKELERIKNQIEQNNNKLTENIKYKSIIYTNGDILHEIVKEMLNDIFNDSLENFKDLKKEDFLIELDNNISFIGEVKGVNTNVKNPHIHQIVGRKLDYEEINPNKETHPILIINYLRDREIENRDNISAEQIKYAKRDNCLIISTITFLKLYEKYKKEELSKEDIIKILKNEQNIGEFKIG